MILVMANVRLAAFGYLFRKHRCLQTHVCKQAFAITKAIIFKCECENITVVWVSASLIKSVSCLAVKHG